MREISLEQFAKARQSIVPIGGHQLTIQRPSKWDVAIAQASKQAPNLEWAVGFVVDWDFKESDLLPGGDPEPVVFNRGVMLGWLKENVETWQPLIEAVIGAYRTHEDAKEERGNA